MVDPRRPFTREQLRRPPLVEALLELQAVPTVPYAIVPGALNQQLARSYPTVEQLNTFAVGDIQIQMPPNVATIRLKSADGKRLVQIGPEVLTVNMVGDYGQYENFQAAMSEALSAFFEVARPGPIRRLGIRYINLVEERFLSGKDPLRFDASFQSVVLPDKKSFAIRAVFPFADAHGELAIAAARPHALSDGRSGCLLDFDFFSLNPGEMTVQQIGSWANEGHHVIYQAFRSLLGASTYSQLL
jgi:uncharacterized protein (TIGR04255 family)